LKTGERRTGKLASRAYQLVLVSGPGFVVSAGHQQAGIGVQWPVVRPQQPSLKSIGPEKLPVGCKYWLVNLRSPITAGNDVFYLLEIADVAAPASFTSVRLLLDILFSVTLSHMTA